ncbi:MAG: COX15/CtaA family protein [Acidimicrobiales bacterium]
MLFADRFRPTPRQYLRITQVAVFALAAIIVTGAAVRLTGSGLGCTDWPLCEAGKPVAPLEFHPMIEFVNRLITGFVSAAVIAAVLGSLRRRPRRTDLTRWSWALVIGVVVQIIVGAFVTLSELKYSVVALHFLISMVLVWAAVVLMHRAADESADVADGAVVPARRRFTTECRVMVGLGAAVLASGSLVTSAGKHPGALPDSSGIEHVVKRLPIDLTTIARVHSALVWLLCLTVLVTVVRLRTANGRAARVATELLIVVVAQGALGYVQYFAGVPALMVAFHVAGATLVWVMTLRLAYATATERATSVVADGVPLAARSAS